MAAEDSSAHAATQARTDFTKAPLSDLVRRQHASCPRPALPPTVVVSLGVARGAPPRLAKNGREPGGRTRDFGANNLGRWAAAPQPCNLPLKKMPVGRKLIQRTTRTPAESAHSALSRLQCGSRWSRPVSRVLSRTVIPLGSPSPATSSGLPGSAGGHPLPLAWRLSYLALLQVGFAVPSVLPRPRCALTAPFHPCRRHCWRLGGLLSVALSVGSRRPGVTWHLVHRSPDFPPHFARNAATVRPTPRAP